MPSSSPNARRLKSGQRPLRRALLAALVCAASLPLLASAALRRDQARPSDTKRNAATTLGVNEAQGQNSYQSAKKPAARRVLTAQSLNCANPSTPIIYGQTINAALSAQDCPNPFDDGTYYDAYTFSGNAGQQVVIDMTSTAFDTYLYLMRPGETDISPDPNVTVQDDDSGGGTNARITLLLATTGTYTILADAYGNGITQAGTGPYALALTNPSSPGVLQLSSSTYSVGEGGGSATITVTRTGGSDGAASVAYATSDGTATAGSDYTAASGTLDFADGQTQQTFAVQITDDQVFESNETFGVTLSNPTGAVLGSPASATVTINENDTCGYTLAQPGRTVAAAGGSFTDSYHTLVGCAAPAVSSNSAFITAGTVTAPDSSGNGTFAYTVAANPNSAQRTGTLSVADKIFTVTQSGVTCSFSLQSSGQSFTAAGGTDSFGVNASPSDCSWTAASNDNWITINSGASGTGNSSVGYTVAANPNNAQRVGTITAAGQTYTITQSGVACTFSLSPAGRTFTSGGGSDSAAVTAAAPDCQWTASTNDNWITINSGTPGTGSGALNYTVAANPNNAQRAGTISIAGQTFNVTQTGVTCTFTLSASSQSFTASGGASSVVVTAAAQDCQWTATSNDSWITVTSGTPGTGNGSIGFTVSANPNSASRSGTITIEGQTLTVNQSGVTCSFSILPTAKSFAYGGGSDSISVTTSAPDCQWSAASNDNWITINSGASGTGSGTINYTVAANPNSASRSGTITAAGQTFNVTQSGVACTFSIQPSGRSFTSAGGSDSVNVTAAAPDCPWAASTGDNWITITSGASGTGSGAVSYSVAASPNSAQRVGTINIAGQTFTVTQTGVACTFTLSSTSQSFGAGGGNGSVGVTAAAQDCQWAATSNDNWITINSGTPGNGNGAVAFTVSANPSSAQRTGTITVAGQTFTVTQASVTCGFSLAPTSQPFAYGGGAGSIVVTANAQDCDWAASRSDNWITITSGSTGTGNGSVGYSVDPNSGPARTSTISVSGQTFNVTQSAAPGVLQFSSATYSVGEGGGSITITVNRVNAAGGAVSVNYATANGTATAGSDYAAASGILNFADGEVSKTFSVPITDDSVFEPNETFTVALSNPAGGASLGAPAAATVTIVENDTCTYALTQSGRTVNSSGGTFGDGYTSLVGCPAPTVTSNSTFITSPTAATPDSSGHGTFGYTVAATPNSAQRTGTLTVAGQTFTVTQTGVSCTFTLSPGSQSFDYAGGTNGVGVTAAAPDCTWTATSNNNWITINSGASGTGNGSVGYTISANTGPARSGTITIAGQTFNVTQSAAPGVLQFSSASYSVGEGAGSVTLTVSRVNAAGGAVSVGYATESGTATAGSDFVAQSGTLNFADGETQKTVTIQINDDAEVEASETFTVTLSNPTGGATLGSPPSATVTINDNDSCSFSLDANSHHSPAAGDTGGFNVISPTGCTWTAASNNNWITINSGASGNGNGAVAFTVPANTGAERTGTITAAGQTYTVTQDSATYKIAGHVTDSNSAPLSGVTVALSGSASAQTTTDVQGNYSFASVNAGGSYTVTPSKAFHTFAPASLSFATLAANQTGANFVGTLGRYTVSGRVTAGAGDALAGVTITMSGDAAGTATTDAQGNYSFTNVAGGASVTVTPALANYTFAPAQQAINLDGDRAGVNFVATPLPTTLQFSQVQYAVAEDALRVVVTVTRAGNTSTSVGVDVRTVDNPAPVPCGDTTTMPGVAFARCDYATTVETVTFAPGETAKTISVPIIDDSWVDPGETFQLALSNPSGGAQVGQQATTAVAITDNDAPGGQNPIFNADFFVRMQYLDFLSREPDAAGSAAWVSTLNNCAAGDITCDRVAVSRNFFLSTEFQLKGLFVFHFYKAAFGRMPHYSEIVVDMSAVTGTTTAELIAKKAAFTDAFTRRQEFKDDFDNLSDAAYVNALLDRYGLQQITAPNPATPDDQSSKLVLSRADLVGRLTAGTLTRAQVLRAVADSDEVGAAEFNPAFVAMQYFGYLRRDPEPQGYSDWLRTINASPSDVRSMVNGFVNSTEYRLRFGQP